MGKIILPQNHITLTSCEQMCDAAIPFQKYGILFIDYVRVYTDRSRLHLTTSLEWVDFFLNNYYSEKFIFFETAKNVHNNFQYSFVNLWNKFNNAAVSEEIADKFGVGNGITIAKQQNGFTEYFYLGADPSNTQIYDIYLNNPTLLNQLTFYLKEKIESLIVKADQCRIPPPIIDTHQSDPLSEKDEIEDFDAQRYYFYENDILQHLSKREHECLKLAAVGKSALEIGVILAVSKRTVEQHMQNIKEKFNCFKIQHLIYKALKRGIPL